MKHNTRALLTCLASALALSACDQRAPTSDAIEASAAKLAEFHGVEDYTIVVVDPPAVQTMPPAMPVPLEVDELASEPQDPEEMRCYQIDEECAICLWQLFRCDWLYSNCLGNGVDPSPVYQHCW